MFDTENIGYIRGWKTFLLMQLSNSRVHYLEQIQMDLDGREEADGSKKDWQARDCPL